MIENPGGRWEVGGDLVQKKVFHLQVSPGYEIIPYHGPNLTNVREDRENLKPSVFEYPCAGRCWLEPSFTLSLSGKVELGASPKRVGGFFHASRFDSGLHGQPGLTGNLSPPLRRFQAGFQLESENLAGEEWLFGEVGLGVVWYRMEPVNDPLYGLDAGSRSNLRADHSDINGGVGGVLRGTLNGRWAPFGEKWPAFFTALDLFLIVWGNSDISLYHVSPGAGLRAGLSFFFLNSE